MKNQMLIGLTGGIGSGKSVVSRFWSTYTGIKLIDIDQLCRELVEVEQPGWVTLKENLGASFFKSDGSLDRVALRLAIFENDALRERVNQLIHPLALDLFHREVAETDQSVLVEVPLLFEAGWESEFQCSVVVYADPHCCCNRVSSRDDISPDKAAKAIVAQMGMWEKAMLADHVIDNRYGWFRTRMQVVHLAKLLGTDGCSYLLQDEAI